MVLWTIGLRGALSRPGRTLLTLLSIVIGVAAVVAISIATSTTRLAYREMFATFTGRAALEITAESGGSFDENVADQAAQVSGVRAAVPLLQRPTVLYAKGRRIKLAALGVDPTKDQAVRDYELAHGQSLEQADGALLELHFAQSMGLALGDEIGLLTRRGSWKLPVAGLVRAKGASSVYLGSMVLVPLEGLQEAFGAPGQVDMVQIVLRDSADAEGLLPQIAARLPAGVRAARPARQTHLIEEMLTSTDQGLYLAMAFSLLLAMFIILNTFLMNVTERRRQLAILRAIGATREQIACLLLGESLLLGTVGTVLGIAAGLGGARLLTRALDELLMTSLPAMTLTPTPFVLAIVFGLGISLLGAWAPARRAARLSPLEGIDGVVREDMEGSSYRFIMAGAASALAGIVLIVLCVPGRLRPEYGILGAVFLLLGIVLLIPLVLDGLVSLTSRLFSSRMRVEARLAHRQVRRHHSRSALTVGVLFVACTTGVGIACTVLDNLQSVRNWYRRTIVGDFFVRALLPDMATGLAADLPEAVGDELRKLPGITRLDTIRFVRARAADQPIVVILRDFQGDDQVYFDLKAGDSARICRQLREGEVVVGTVLAQRSGLAEGDRISVETLEGPRPFRIAGLTNEYMMGGLVVYMQREVGKKWLGADGVDGYFIQADRSSLAQVQTQLQALCDRHGVFLHSFADITRIIEGMMVSIDGCMWGILILGFVVAALGVINTLTMNVLEQTREFGLLRVVAMTRWQVRKTILTQAVLLAVAGLAPGVGGGLILSYIINLATLPAIGHPVEFSLHPELLASAFLAAFLLVLTAAWLPAERAARLHLAEALQYE